MRTGVAGRIEAENQLAKPDRLLRAAISGFCSLTLPTRLDASRLDQLAQPLLPLVTVESRRYAAAALSRAYPGPQGLIRRLAEDDVAVSAPILVGSPVLTDIDLIGLIGRHGLAHAAAIGRRAPLNANIAALIRALGVSAEAAAMAGEAAEPPAEGARPPFLVRAEAARKALEITAQAIAPASSPTMSPAAAPGPANDAPAAEAEPVAAAFDDYVRAEPGAAEEAARDRLREMMLPAGSRAPSRAHAPQPPALPALDWTAVAAAAGKLVATGLTGKAALFHTALADAFDLDFRTAASIAEAGDLRRLSTALKAADLPSAQAFLIAALAFPPRFATTAAIRAFIETYAAIDVEKARRAVSSWRNAPAAAQWPRVANLADGGATPLPDMRRVKAS